MRDSRGLLILLAVVVVAAVVVWFATRRPSEPTPPPLPEPEAADIVRLDFDGLEVDSPDLAVGPARARVAVQDGFSSWSVAMSCAEPDGCAGELAIVIDFDTGDDEGRIVLAGRFDVSAGGELRFEGLQEPAMPVSDIDRVRLEVRHRGSEAEVISEPIQ